MKCTTTLIARDAQSNVWTDALGRKAGAVYFDSLGHRRVVTPPEFYDDDGNLVATGTEAVAAFSAMVHERQIKRRDALRPTTVRRQPRARGARRPKVRSSARRSSERSGDSGDGSDSPEPDSDSPEPPRRWLCAFCGKDIPSDRSPKATHCSNRHADRDRKRRQRQRDRERNQLPPTPTTADFRRMLELTAEERDWLRALVVCRCNGRHLEFEPGECFRCGRHLPHGVGGGKELYAAFVAAMA